MREAWLLLPDFLLIALGWALCRGTPLGRPVWDGVERLVYHLLFPGLLFYSIVRHPLALATAAPLVAAALAVVGTGIVLALAWRAPAGEAARLHASGAQVAFRFNTYIALAMADRLGGAAGLAGMAVLLAAGVPVVNLAAVWALARHGGQGVAREMLRNPLLLATLAGLAFNAFGLRLPELAALTLSRLGAAALPLGLMAVGAGLTFGALREAPRLALALLAIRHAALPAVGLACAVWLPLPPLQQGLVLAFSALPAAPAAYVLAVRMGGHGPFVAGLVTLSTLLAMVGLPLAMMAWHRIAPG